MGVKKRGRKRTPVVYMGLQIDFVYRYDDPLKRIYPVMRVEKAPWRRVWDAIAVERN